MYLLVYSLKRKGINEQSNKQQGNTFLKLQFEARGTIETSAKTADRKPGKSREHYFRTKLEAISIV